MSITHHTEAEKLTMEFVERVKDAFKGKRIRITVEEVAEYDTVPSDTMPQLNESTEQYLTAEASEHSVTQQEAMVAQALRAEQEILEGKGLTASEARAFMQASLKG